MRKLVQSKFAWGIVIAGIVVSALFTIFVCAGKGTHTDNMQKVQKATTEFTQTITR